MKGEDQIRDEELSNYLESTEEHLKKYKVTMITYLEAENEDEAVELVKKGDVEGEFFEVEKGWKK